MIDILVSEAYGERTGNGFVKVAPNGQKLSDFFTNTEAYDNLILELISSEDNLLHFLSGCLNRDAQERVNVEFEKLKSKRAEGESTEPKLTLVDDSEK